ncbi:hypothetical protein N7492_008780 [Penicillium capsulatum]|uniref:Glutathione S-transferase n=1 Tax=Penicillium capsulatum TaxID=69766 RepID=A0A9W9HSL1_9EURO|nr:hypothetical protein N7492_008780 [Penicillium capsulatum]KAJ6106182.1 hypothetical protein N7512_009699 [Penicillium capsulatum]
MPLTLHHLDHSQSERIIWLAEELGLDYNYVFHQRSPLFAPQSLRDVHPMGSAPVIEDDPSPITGTQVKLAESSAIVEYIIAAHGNGRFARTPKDGEEYVHYLEWFHFANGSFQPGLFRVLMSRGADPNSPIVERSLRKWEHLLSLIDARLAKTGAYLAGLELTAADIMIFVTLTTMRGFATIEFDTTKHANILAYLQRVGERPAYQKAIKICEGEDFVPLLGAKVEPFAFMKRWIAST